MPNSISMSTGSLFAGYVMHRTGRYKTINLIFGFFPFIGSVLISLMRQDSGPIQSWLSIVSPSHLSLVNCKVGLFLDPAGFRERSGPADYAQCVLAQYIYRR